MDYYDRKLYCASPRFPPGCQPQYPLNCEPESGWFLTCDIVQGGIENCVHSLDGSFFCYGNQWGTSCWPDFNDCTPFEDSAATCWRNDLGYADVTCHTSVSGGDLMFACDSPTVGSFTCTEHDADDTFTCP